MTNDVVEIAIAGVGKIARDQHIPAIAANPRFSLAATVTRHNTLPGVPNFADVAALHAAMPSVRAIAICTPPRGRIALVKAALANGMDVLIEKPPAATLSEAEMLVDLSKAGPGVVYATWHSREAAGVEPARAWLADRTIVRVAVTWAEDVRIWHPGQEWIWEPGIGVFDPGINALSILTRILPGSLMIERAILSFPQNRAAPIAAQLELAAGNGVPVTVEMDFDRKGPQVWAIEVETDRGALLLTDGGGKLSIEGQPATLPGVTEYDRLYRRFAWLITARQSDVDIAPFRLVSDAFLLGERRVVADFNWN